MGDDVLGRDLDHLDAHIDAHHFLDERDQQHEARSLDASELAQGEDHGALILAQDLDRGGQDKHDDQKDRRAGQEGEGIHGVDAFLGCRRGSGAIYRLERDAGRKTATHSS